MSDFTFKDINAKKKPFELAVDVITDGELARRIEALVKDYQAQLVRDKRLNEPAKAPAILKQIEDLRDQAEEVTYTFIFRDIGRKAFEDMQDEYPATPAQEEDGFRYNPEEFGPRLLASSCIQPSLTLEDARTIWNDWGQGEVNALFGAAVSVCAERASIPFIGTDLQRTLDSTRKSNTATSTESPTPISLAGN